MKKTIINLAFVLFALPAMAFANGEWYTDDYSYDSGSWYTNDYSYNDTSWSTDDYSYNNSWYTDDYSYNNTNWYTDDYSYSNSYYPQSDLVYNQNYYSVYQDPYYYTDYGYNQDYYYNDDYYYYDDYYYGGGCRSNCGGSYNPPTRYDDLDVICTVSDRTIEEGDSVTFTADADGGDRPYDYRWSGDASGSSRSITKRFNSAGTYYVSVRVTDDDGRTATANCGSVRVEDEDDEDFDAVCKVSDSSIEKGDTVRFTADVDGGDSPYDYDWSGDVNEDDRTFTKRFNRTGTYEIDLKVTDDDGNVARDTCTVRVGDDDDRDIVTTVYKGSTGGNLASVGSVYLNQIPYTGPEDTAKGIAFVVGILAWSIAGALIIRNKMNKKSVTNRIEAFKNANKTTIA